MNTPIQHLHATWNRITGQNIPMGVCAYELEHGWHEYLKAGYTEADLVMVVGYLQREIKKEARKPAALRWRNCIGDLLRFAEEIELARGSMKRKVPETPLSRAMHQLRPVVTHTTPEDRRSTAVSVSDLIDNLKRAAGMTA